MEVEAGWPGLYTGFPPRLPTCAGDQDSIAHGKFRSRHARGKWRSISGDGASKMPLSLFSGRSLFAGEDG